MPVNKSLASNLEKQYGKKKAVAVYHAMENKGDPAFKKGVATAKKEGHTQAHFTTKKKPAGAKDSGSPIAPRAIAKRGDPKLGREAPPKAARNPKKGDAVDRRMGAGPAARKK